MKKIGLLSLYYKTYNYGAQLQAYALQKAISQMGYDCEQIQFDWSNEETKLSYETASIDHNGFNRFYNSIPHSSKVYTPKNIRNCASNYDAFVCGSDQIWGVDKQMPPYVLPMMALSFVPESKLKISYAASMGALSCSAEKQEILKATLKRLNAISVREKGATGLIEALSNKKVEYVLDPTFLLSKKQWNAVAQDPQINEKYILVYGLGNNLSNNQLVKNIAQTKNAKIVNLSYISGQSHNPCTFLGLVKNAECIISNSYHATIFSIIYNKPFFALPADSIDNGYSKNTRVLDLLQQLNIQNRFIDWGVTNLNIDSINSIDYATVNKLLGDLIDKSYSFLKKSLSTEIENKDYVVEPEKCCLCNACVLSCKQNSITLETNTYGFQNIHINHDTCINCGVCRDICPVINKNHTVKNNYTLRAFSAVAKNVAICKNSSSGGAFFTIASKFISEGGIVFGARYDNEFNVVHSYCNNIDDLYKFMGSKYVHSDIGETYKLAEKFLQGGQKVLFSGTPCQIYALKSFLKKDYESLFTVDLICHGTPYPELFKKYISHINKDNSLKNISMRSKELGAININSKRPLSFVTMCVELQYEHNREVISTSEDMFFSLFLSNGFLTASCYNCAFKDVERISDITLGDFHGIAAIGGKDIAKYKNGVSLILLQSQKGDDLFSNCCNNLEIEEYAPKDALLHNIMMCNNAKLPPEHDYMNAIFSSSSIEKLYYKNILFKEYKLKQNEVLDSERTKRVLNIKKHLITICSEEFFQKIGSQTFLVYGFGEIGEMLYSKFPSNVLAFIDQGTNRALFYDIPIFRMDTLSKAEFSEKLSDIPVVITLTEGHKKIKTELTKRFPNIKTFFIADII